MGAQYASRARLAELFGIERVAEMIVCSSDGEELEDDDLLPYFAQTKDKLFTVLDEYFLDRSDHQHDDKCDWHSHDGAAKVKIIIRWVRHTRTKI